ncbi:MAG TPA: GNAT family N-acetyltransferase [Mycobacteriales bacterium]|nr:GNAT family N-acetyltransferase [Mycobacteriales bacterium]
MLVAETVTYLEMNSPDQLRPGRGAPAPVGLERHDVTSLPLISSAYAHVGKPYHWTGRLAWSREKWEEWLSRPGLRLWLPRVAGEVAGTIELEVQPDGDVEIVVFGLVPEFVGKGFGGHILTLGARLAWETEQCDGGQTRRVWLHTSSFDNRHAKQNYLARGFRVFQVRRKHREIPDDAGLASDPSGHHLRHGTQPRDGT